MSVKHSPDDRCSTHHTGQALRQLAVKAVSEGQSPATIAKVLGVNRRTVYRWVTAFQHEGASGLLTKPIPGRPAVLLESDLAWLSHCILGTVPQDHGFQQGLWSVSAIQGLIEKKMGKRVSSTTVHRLAHSLGIPPHRSLERGQQRGCARMLAWEAKVLPQIRARAKAAGATIYVTGQESLDAVPLSRMALPCRVESREATNGLGGLTLISAVGPRRQRRFMVHQGLVDEVVIVTFLQRMLLEVVAPISLIVGDPAGYYQHKTVDAFVRESRDRLELYFSPG